MPVRNEDKREMSYYDIIEFLEPYAEFYEKVMKGIRIKALQNLILFLLEVKIRFNSINWEQWQNRNPKKRKHLRRLLINYLDNFDREEINYYVQRIGVSPRTVRDYLNTLRSIINLLGIII